MSSSNHPIIASSDPDIEDAFSSTNVADYFPASSGNTSLDSSNNFTKYLLATLVFSPLHDDSYMEVMQAYDATNELHIPPLQAPIASPTIVPLVLSLFDSRDFFPPEEISPPKDVETPIESFIPVSPSSSVGSSSPVRRLPRSIKGNITALKPQTLKEAITITQRLMEQVIKHNSAQETNDHKQKFEDRRNTTNNNNNYPNDRNNNNRSNNRNNNYQDNHNNNNRNNDYHQQQNRRHETFRTYTGTNGYTGNRPLCERCTLHHIGPFTVKCQTCNRVGHLTSNCRNKRPATRNNLQPISVTCNACGKKGHYANQCSKANNRATGKHTY
nr:hypothetical protein [Tanacetum cinerariifolium]